MISVSSLCFAFLVRSVSGRPLPGHSGLGASPAGWGMDRRAGCTTAPGVSERWLHRPSIQAKRHPQRQAQTGFSGLGEHPNLSRERSNTHIYTYLRHQGDGWGSSTAASDPKGDGRKRRQAQKRGAIAVHFLFLAQKCIYLCIYLSKSVISPFSGWHADRVVGRNEGFTSCCPRSEPEDRVAGEAARPDRRWRCMRWQDIHHIVNSISLFFN